MNKPTWHLIAFLLLASPAIALNAVQADIKPVSEVRLTVTADSLRLFAWLTPSPDSARAPLLLLLPMMAHTHDSYGLFVEALAKHPESSSAAGSNPMPHILSFDLRGHGQSVCRSSDTLHWRNLSEAEFAKYPGDVSQAVKSVLADTGLRIDSDSIIVVGASIGANTAIMLIEILPGISRVVMLSPGENYRGLKPAEALKKFKGKVLIFAATDDEYSAASSRRLLELNQDHCAVRMFRGKDHGTDIINNDPRAMARLIEWLNTE